MSGVKLPPDRATAEAIRRRLHRQSGWRPCANIFRADCQPLSLEGQGSRTTKRCPLVLKTRGEGFFDAVCAAVQNSGTPFEVPSPIIATELGGGR